MATLDRADASLRMAAQLAESILRHHTSHGEGLGQGLPANKSVPPRANQQASVKRTLGFAGNWEFPIAIYCLNDVTVDIDRLVSPSHNRKQKGRARNERRSFLSELRRLLKPTTNLAFLFSGDTHLRRISICLACHQTIQPESVPISPPSLLLLG